MDTMDTNICVSLLVKGERYTHETHRNRKNTPSKYTGKYTRQLVNDSSNLRKLLAKCIHKKKCMHARNALTRLAQETIKRTRAFETRAGTTTNTRTTAMGTATKRRRWRHGNRSGDENAVMVVMTTNMLMDRDDFAAEKRGLRGGGGDGGTTGAESRSTYLDMYKEKKKDKADKETALLNVRRSCALTGATLQAEACVDAAGQLINKEELIRRMLDGSLKRMTKFGHIRSLKDVEDAKLVRQPRGQRDGDVHASTIIDSKSNKHDGSETGFCCPVLGIPLDTRAGFVLLKGTGMVVCEKALRQAKEVLEDMTGVTIDGNRVLKLFPTEDEVEEVRATIMEARKAKSEKKQMLLLKQKKKNDKIVSVADGVIAATTGLKRKGGQLHTDDTNDNRNDTGGAAASTTGKGIADKGAVSQEEPKTKIMPSKSAPRGVRGSDVYKSIFSSSRAADKDGSGGGGESFCARSVSARGFALR